MGWCLGGYFATETLRRFFQLNSSIHDSFQCFINNKSFSSIRDFLYYIMPKYTRLLLKTWPISKYVRKWNSDTGLSLDELDQNFQNIYVVYSESDKVVNGLAHVYKHVSELAENVEIREDTGRDDHRCNWDLLAEILKSKTQKNNENDLFRRL